MSHLSRLVILYHACVPCWLSNLKRHEGMCPCGITPILLLFSDKKHSAFNSLFNIKCYLDRHRLTLIITQILLSVEHLQWIFLSFSLLRILRTVLDNFTCTTKLNPLFRGIFQMTLYFGYQHVQLFVFSWLISYIEQVYSTYINLYYNYARDLDLY